MARVGNVLSVPAIDASNRVPAVCARLRSCFWKICNKMKRSGVLNGLKSRTVVDLGWWLVEVNFESIFSRGRNVFQDIKWRSGLGPELLQSRTLYPLQELESRHGCSGKVASELVECGLCDGSNVAMGGLAGQQSKGLQQASASANLHVTSSSLKRLQSLERGTRLT